MEHVRSVSREFVTGDEAVLHLESRSGSVVVEGRQSDRVIVDAVVRVSTEIEADADDAVTLVERNIEQDGQRVMVRAPSLQPSEGWGVFLGRKSARIDYHVRVPVATEVRLLSKSGAVDVRGVARGLLCEVASGRAEVRDCAGEVTVQSRSGSVQVERVQGKLRVESRSGRVRVRAVDGALAVESRSGSVEVSEVAGDAQIMARSGSISMEHMGARLKARSHAGSVRFRGAVRGDMDIEAHAGSITFAVDPAALFFIDAVSDVGSVRSDLPPRRKGGAPPEGGPKVRLRTRAGSIRITRA